MTWFRTTSATASLVVGLGLAVAGVALGRGDVVALASLPVIGAAVAATRPRPDGAAGPTLTRVPGAEPGTHEARLTLAVETRVRLTVPGFRELTALLAPGEATASFRSARTGEIEGFRLDWAPVAQDGTLEQRTGTLEGGRIVVEPRVLGLRDLPLPAQLVGLTGVHSSRRRGDGEDLHDIAPFRPGDRLRNIDWRVTARRGTSDPRVGTQLHVRRTQAMADAVVMLVLDSRDDVGVDVRTWAGGTGVVPTEPTSLDIARQACASLASGYIGQGDRVGLADLATRRRPVPPGGGKRHLDRLVHAIALARPEGEPVRRFRPPRITTEALVVVVSTFLDDGAATSAVEWAALGHRVIAVDVLPDVWTADLGPAEKLAARLVLAERSARTVSLRRTGIPVVRWDARQAQELQVLARTSERSPR